jgi:hypothetical protein
MNIVKAGRQSPVAISKDDLHTLLLIRQYLIQHNPSMRAVKRTYVIK